MPSDETSSPPSSQDASSEAAVAAASPLTPQDALSNGERLHTSESQSADDEVDEDESSASPFVTLIRRPSILRRENSPRLATDHRNIRFNSRVRFYFHLHLNDFTDEELDASFLKEEDLARIHRDIFESITRMRANNHQNQQQDVDEEEELYCPRGLEHVSTPPSMAALRNARTRHIDAVLDEQDRQFLRGETDEDRLAQISVAARSRTTAQAMVAQDSVARAILLGAADAAFVQQVVRPEVLAVEEEVEEVEEEPPNDEGDELSSVLQAAMYISSPSTITAAASSSVATPNSNPDLVRVGSRERLLDILGHLRSGLEETHSEIEQISQTARRDSRRASSPSSSSNASSPGDDEDEPNATIPEERSEPST